MLKINTDASWKDANSCTAGIVVRHCSGSWIYGSYIKIKASSPAEAEVVAMREGLMVATVKDLNRFQLEVDAKAVEVMMDHAEEHFTHYPGAIVTEVSRLIGHFWNMEILHARKEANVVAHTLAKEGQLSNFCAQNFEDPPSWIQTALDHDMQGIRFQSQ